jgi:hypothetical protein
MDKEEQSTAERRRRSQHQIFSISTAIIIIFVNLFIIIVIRYLLDRSYQHQKLLTNTTTTTDNIRKNRIDTLLLANDGLIRQQLSIFIGIFATTFCFCCCCCFCCGGQMCLCFTKCHPRYWRQQPDAEIDQQQQPIRRKITVVDFSAIRTAAATDRAHRNYGFEADLDRYEKKMSRAAAALPEIKVTDSHGIQRKTKYFEEPVGTQKMGILKSIETSHL